MLTFLLTNKLALNFILATAEVPAGVVGLCAAAVRSCPACTTDFLFFCLLIICSLKFDCAGWGKIC